MKEDQFNTLLQIVARQGDRIEELIVTMNARFDAVDKRFAAVDVRLDATDTRLDAIEARLGVGEASLDTLERTMKRGFTDQAKISLGILKHIDERLGLTHAPLHT